MIDTILEPPDGVLHGIQALLRGLLEKGVVDALLVPMRLSATVPGGHTAPMLVTDPAALDRADPLAPVLPINAARAASSLTNTGQKAKVGLVLRACEIRALVELVKFQQAKLDNALIVGVDCLGAFRVTDWQAAGGRQQAVRDGLLRGAVTGEIVAPEGLAFRAACAMCEQPLPAGEHVGLSLGLVGVEPGGVWVQARDEVGRALGLEPGGGPPLPLVGGNAAGRAAAVSRLVAARTQARDAALAEWRSRVGSPEALLAEFGACLRCHNCMVNCPICYCKECIFRTATFEHESEVYYQWAARKGTVRLLPDTVLFHLTRLNHMATSCVGCGVCTEACPVDIPVATAFRAVGEQVQALFDYQPGRSLDEAAPVQEFREDELKTLGERPH